MLHKRIGYIAYPSLKTEPNLGLTYFSNNSALGIVGVVRVVFSIYTYERCQTSITTLTLYSHNMPTLRAFFFHLALLAP